MERNRQQRPQTFEITRRFDSGRKSRILRTLSCLQKRAHLARIEIAQRKSLSLLP